MDFPIFHLDGVGNRILIAVIAMNEKIPIVLLAATLSDCWRRKTLMELAPLGRELAQDLIASFVRAQSAKRLDSPGTALNQSARTTRPVPARPPRNP